MAQSRFFLRRAVQTASASMERWVRAKNLINQAASSFAVFGPVIDRAPRGVAGVTRIRDIRCDIDDMHGAPLPPGHVV